jgi:ABC-2 type transport system ATP-binding protein
VAETATPVIDTVGLTKYYGRRRGLDGLDLEVRPGEVYGFLGPNGAGKTTTIRLLLDLIRPTSGAAHVLGTVPREGGPALRRRLGYLSGDFTVDGGQTSRELLTHLGHLRGGVSAERIAALAGRLELELDVRIRSLSKGNRQKVGLVQAFMHRPRLLVLDEPTAGLDPLNQQEFYRLLAEIQAEGRSVLLSSHLLPEVERVCSRVAIIRDGQLVDVNQISSLKHLRQQNVVVRFAAAASLAWFRGLPGVQAATAENGGLEVHLRVQGDLDGVIKVAGEHGATNIVTREPSLEEIFLRFYADDPEPRAAAADDR